MATKETKVRHRGKAYALAITREDEAFDVQIALPSGDVINGMHDAGGLGLSDYTVGGERCPITGDLYERIADRVASVCESWDWDENEGDDEDSDE